MSDMSKSVFGDELCNANRAAGHNEPRTAAFGDTKADSLDDLIDSPQTDPDVAHMAQPPQRLRVKTW